MKVLVFKTRSSIHDMRRLVSDEIHRGFLHFGCDSVLMDFASEYLASDVEKEFKEKIDLVVTFGTDPVSVIECNGEPLVNQLNIPVISFFLDAPYFFPDRLEKQLSKHIVTISDKGHLENFFNLCMPDCKTVCTAFLPHAGISAGTGFTEEQFESRSSRLLYIASHIDKPLEKPWERINKKLLRELHEDVYNCLDEDVGIDEAILKVLAYNGINLEKELLNNVAICIFSNLIWYEYAIYRNKMIDHLAENGYEVDIFGDGWEGKYAKHPNIQYKGSLHITDTIKMLNNYKLTLNPYVSPHGTHERIFFALANGCQCLTMGSTELKKIFTDNKGIHFVTRKNFVNDIDGKIKQALKKTTFASIKSTNQYVLDKHMWKNRVEQMLSLWEMDKFRI